MNKEYYEQKLKDKLEQRNKSINRLIADIYQFVQDNEGILAEVNNIQENLNEKLPQKR